MDKCLLRENMEAGKTFWCFPLARQKICFLQVVGGVPFKDDLDQIIETVKVFHKAAPEHIKPK